MKIKINRPLQKKKAATDVRDRTKERESDRGRVTEGGSEGMTGGEIAGGMEGGGLDEKQTEIDSFRSLGHMNKPAQHISPWRERDDREIGMRESEERGKRGEKGGDEERASP
jgi:hypothetical protein